jgi:hypothetical protein
MTRYLLDTSALLTLQDNEAGADRVAEVLRLAGTGSAKCFGCFISLMETHYRVGKDEDQAAGQLAYRQCLALPIDWVPQSEPLLIKSAEFKALFPISNVTRRSLRLATTMDLNGRRPRPAEEDPAADRRVHHQPRAHGREDRAALRGPRSRVLTTSACSPSPRAWVW